MSAPGAANEIPAGTLMQGKRGLIMGVANNRSIAWGIAKATAAQGATLAFTYQGDALKKRVEPLAAEVGSKLVLPCDVTDKVSVEVVFAELGRQWGKLDFLVHAIAYGEQLDGRNNVLVITAKGRALRRAMWPVYARAIEEHFGAHLTQAEAEQLARLLTKLVQAESG